ncbi:MAG: aldo/keto reductase [Pseudomonadota bacterium]
MDTLTTPNGTPISRLTFGTMQFGGTADAAESKAMFEAARAAGINHFDTAVGYNGGASEEILGGLLADCRDEVFVATKVGYVGGASAANINTQFETCQKQLALDAVDLLYMHRFDDETPLEETFGALAALQTQGLIRYIGVSNYAAWQIMKAQGVAAALGTRIDAIQPMYSLVKRQAEVEIFSVAADQGITIFPYSPLGGGLLTGKYAEGGSGRLTDDPRYKARYAQAWMHGTAKGLRNLAKGLGVEAATLAVAWAARHPAQPHPIISARSVEQLGPSLAAAEFDLTDEFYDRITALSITPAPATDRLEEG